MAVLERPGAGAAVRMVRPLLGFPDAVDFDLCPVSPGDPLARLVCRTEDAAHFITCPADLIEGYSPALPVAVLGELGHPDADDLLVLVVLNLSDPRVGPTANLLAPVLVNTRTGDAVQVVLEEAYPVAAPLN